jgi:hypothetical protein
MSLVRGMCYEGFPAPYNPSMANHTCLFFGSDAAALHMRPLWGADYQSSKGSSCGAYWNQNGPFCRDDVTTMKDMGVELVRLYDWEPRNDHVPFLDHCQRSGLGVLAPVSNYFLKPGEGFPKREQHIPNLIRSYANQAGTDYHPAVMGVIMGNELDGYGAEQCVAFTQDWVRIQAAQFPGFRPIRLGHPVQFNPFGARFPCFGFWNALLPPLMSDPAIARRLFLAPQTYNEAVYLFENAEGSGAGWVDQAWNAYKLPIWFTEIGLSRTKPNFAAVVAAQLKGVQAYAAQHPERLLGACFFQFADKVWVPGTSEGSFGAFSHSTNILCRIQYGAEDFTHWENSPCEETLAVDVLTKTALYDAVVSAYR